MVHDAPDLSCPRTATSDFVYVRLRSDGYDEAALESWSTWFQEQTDQRRDVFVYLKHEGQTSPQAILGRWTAAHQRPARRAAGSASGRRARRSKDRA